MASNEPGASRAGITSQCKNAHKMRTVVYALKSMKPAWTLPISTSWRR